MKKLSALFLLALGLISFNACTSDDEKMPVEEQMVEVGFELTLGEIQIPTKTGNLECPPPDEPVKEPCVDPDDINDDEHHLYIKYTLDGEEKTMDNIEIKNENGTVYTKDLLKLPKDSKFIVKLVELHKNTTSTSHPVVYRSIDADAPTVITSLVKNCLPKDCDIDKLTKKYVPISLYCSTNYTPADFGYYGFNIEAVEAVCLKYSVNLCGDPCKPNELMQHTVAPTKISIQRVEWSSVKDAWCNAGDIITGTQSVVGEYGEICFADLGTIEDAYEGYKIEIDITTPSGGILTYKATITVEKLRNWENIAKGFQSYLHFQVCPDSWLESCNATLYLEKDDKEFIDAFTGIDYNVTLKCNK